MPGPTSLQESLSPPASRHPALGSHHGRLGESSEEEEVDGEEDCGDEVIAGHHQHPHPLHTHWGVCKQNRVSLRLLFLKLVISYLVWSGLPACRSWTPAQWMAQLLDAEMVTSLQQSGYQEPGECSDGGGGGGYVVLHTSVEYWLVFKVISSVVPWFWRRHWIYQKHFEKKNMS